MKRHARSGSQREKMTANSFEEDVSAALNAGMNGHIAKPIDAQILYEVLDKLAKKQQ